MPKPIKMKLSQERVNDLKMCVKTQRAIGNASVNESAVVDYLLAFHIPEAGVLLNSTILGKLNYRITYLGCVCLGLQKSVNAGVIPLSTAKAIAGVSAAQVDILHKSAVTALQTMDKEKTDKNTLEEVKKAIRIAHDTFDWLKEIEATIDKKAVFLAESN